MPTASDLPPRGLRLSALCFDCLEPARAARFWAELLHGEIVDERHHGVALLPHDDLGFRLRFLPSGQPKLVQNRMHLDLTSRSHEDQAAMVAKALASGARHVDVGQRPEERHVVLADPEGNEFCVIEPGNAFLADCGLVGAVACDGTQEVGYFWSSALGWPLVWDQDEETAIRAPNGGPKITWGGPPLPARVTPDRVRFELAPAKPHDLGVELLRLTGLGATRRDVDGGQPGRVVLGDPDGNEFFVLEP
jgi:catechol 2,3-dioxygenase-like lactoylglutathione lyase family enzyme